MIYSMTLQEAARIVERELLQLCSQEGPDCYRPKWIINGYALSTADLLAHVRALDDIGRIFVYQWASAHGIQIIG